MRQLCGRSILLQMEESEFLIFFNLYFYSSYIYLLYNVFMPHMCVRAAILL